MGSQWTGRRCAVLGAPIAHSLSPALHRAAYDALGLDWRYEALELDSTGLEDFVLGLDEQWRGLSLTMPLKRTVVPLLSTRDAWVRMSGVANTVVLDEGRHGANTDIPGAVAALRERVPGVPRSAVVLGGGATATSVLLALADLGCTHARLLVREPARATETVAAVGSHPQAPAISVEPIVAGPGDAGALEADVLVSTIPAAAQAPDLLARCADVPAVFEVVYDPWPTPLAEAALADGRHLVSGLDLLAHQAVLQVELMTEETVDVDLLREAGAGELARRATAKTATTP